MPDLASPPPSPAPARRRALVWAAVFGLASVGLAAAFVPTRDDRGDAATAAFCLPAPQAALVTAADRRDERYDARVPKTNPPEGIPQAESHPVTQGDVVEFEVTSGRPGTIAVHGFTDLQPVVVGGVATIAFRTIYSGRFPLHFHGTDGSHIEIAALEVMPPAAVAAAPAAGSRH